MPRRTQQDTLALRFSVDALQRRGGIKHEHIDPLIAQSALNARGELHCQPHRPLNRVRAFDQQIDIATTQLVVHAGAEQKARVHQALPVRQ